METLLDHLGDDWSVLSTDIQVKAIGNHFAGAISSGTGFMVTCFHVLPGALYFMTENTGEYL